MAEEETEGKSLPETPSWAVASVIAVMVCVGFLVQGSLTKFGKWLTNTRRTALSSALEKIKEELMLFGLMSLLMGHFSIWVSKICVKSSALSGQFYPCFVEGYHEANYDDLKNSTAAQERGSCPEVHKCNKLASRHVRVGLADPNDVPRCDICENAPAFFYCEIDGSSLCLQCDMIVHVGGKRTHGRYLVLRQRAQFPGDRPGPPEDVALQPNDAGAVKRARSQPPKFATRENNVQNHWISPVPTLDTKSNDNDRVDTNKIDLNTRPNWLPGQASNEQGMDSNNHESASVVPVGSFRRDSDK